MQRCASLHTPQAWRLGTLGHGRSRKQSLLWKRSHFCLEVTLEVGVKNGLGKRDTEEAYLRILVRDGVGRRWVLSSPKRPWRSPPLVTLSCAHRFTHRLEEKGAGQELFEPLCSMRLMYDNPGYLSEPSGINTCPVNL